MYPSYQATSPLYSILFLSINFGLPDILSISSSNTPSLTAYLLEFKNLILYPSSAWSLTTNIPSGKGNFSKSILSDIPKNLSILIALKSLLLSEISKLSHAIFSCLRP